VICGFSLTVLLPDAATFISSSIFLNGLFSPVFHDAAAVFAPIPAASRSVADGVQIDDGGGLLALR
jgi:hypothetical protein